jgi:hypothetical protein
MQWQDAEDRARPDQHRQSEAASSASTIRIESTTRIEEPEDGSEDARAAHARQARREGAGAELRGGLQELERREAEDRARPDQHRQSEAASSASTIRIERVRAEYRSLKMDRRTHGPRTRAKHRGRCRGGGREAAGAGGGRRRLGGRPSHRYAWNESWTAWSSRKNTEP